MTYSRVPEDQPVSAEVVEALEVSVIEAAKPRVDIENVRAHVSAMRQHIDAGGSFYVARWEFLQRAVEDPKLSAQAVRCFASLADFVNSSGLIAWPSYVTLAARLHCSADAVRRLLDQLEAAGYIVRSDSKKRGLRYADGRHFVGKRGSAYAFGLCGHATFQELFAAREADLQPDSDAPTDEIEQAPDAGSEDNEPAPHAGSSAPTPSSEPAPDAGSNRANRHPTPVETREPAPQAGQGNPFKIGTPLASGTPGGDASPPRSSRAVSVQERASEEQKAMLAFDTEPDASGFAAKLCSKLSVAAEDLGAQAKIAGTVQKALLRWDDAPADKRGFKFGFKRYEAYFTSQWLPRLVDDLRVLAAHRTATDAKVAAIGSTAKQIETDQQHGPKFYPAGRPMWLDGVKRHVQIETLNGWIRQADTLHGADIARMADAEAVLPLLEDEAAAPRLIARAAVRRVHRYGGGALSFRPGVIEKVAAAHPAIPRAFVEAYVAQTFADPARVDIDPVRFNGQSWVNELIRATVANLVEEFQEAQAERAAALIADAAREIGNATGEWPDDVLHDLRAALALAAVDLDDPDAVERALTKAVADYRRTRSQRLEPPIEVLSMNRDAD